MVTLVGTIVLLAALAEARTATIAVDTTHIKATFDPASLTAVCIDACALKLGLNFSDPRLVKLTSNLGPGVLRLGGTDQNTWFYDLNETRSNCSACGPWAAGCFLARPYWEEILEFGARTGRRVLFGLNAGGKDPTDDAAAAVANASALVAYTKTLPDRLRGALLGWTFGNELVPKKSSDGPALAAAMRDRIARVRDASGELGGVLVAPDVGLGPRALWTEPAALRSDEKIARSLAYLEEFSDACGDVLDAISFHTYDFRAAELGVVPDDSPLPDPAPANASKFHDETYLDVFEALLAAARNATGRRALWLTETNSVNHHGVPRLTDSYGNSLWLAHRLGVAATAGLALVSRQSLIGFDYPLLTDDLAPTPDYFITALFRKLVVGTEAFAVTSDGGVRAFAFCGAGERGLLLAVNLEATAVSLDVRGFDGPRVDYVLAPGDGGLSSPTMSLNGARLAVGDDGALPAFDGASSATLTLGPLGIAFAAYGGDVAACRA